MIDPLYKIGDKFGKWVIVGDPVRINSQFYYPLKCECGRMTKKSQSTLKDHATKSCLPCSIKQRRSENKLNSRNI